MLYLVRCSIRSRCGALGYSNFQFLLKHFFQERTDVCDRRRFSKSSVRSANDSSITFGASKDEAHIIHNSKNPLSKATLGQLAEEAAKLWPDVACMVSIHQNVRLTYAEALDRADRLAAGLKKLGMKKGDRVGIWSPNDIEWFLTYLACARAGFILVSINPANQQDELTYCMQKTEISVVIAPEEFKNRQFWKFLLQAKDACPLLKDIIIYSKDHISGTHRYIDVESLASRTDVDEIKARQGEISSDDGCSIQFTSGTTGTPKATLMSHKTFVNNGRQTVFRTGMRLGHKICLNVPFYHIFAHVAALAPCLHVGCTIILEARSFNPVKSLDTLAQEKCDITYGTPTMWVNLIDAQKRLNVPTNIFTGTIGGSPAPPELFRRICETFRFDNMKSIYGLTEAGVTFQSLLEETSDLTSTTIGHISDFVESKVVNESGATVPFGTPGELWTRSYCNMIKYWNDEENTAKLITEDGWVKSGDQFILRSDGYGQIIGRYKDVVIRGGENIFPRELENFLLTHPDISEVQIIGAYDKVYGEEVCACIRLRDGAKLTNNDVRKYCEGKIARFKIPRYVEFVKEYPKTTSGKIQKFKLREDLERKGVIPLTPK